MENIEKIDELIVGRVEPHIYAFSTNTIPNYLKIGDTYRPVSVRLKEWRQHFSDLQKEFDVKATVSSEVFFRDYAVHAFLENDLGKHRLATADMAGYPEGTYYSKEFFRDTAKCDVEAAINDIADSYLKNEDKYQFYNASTSLPETHTYPSTGYWQPRPNQQKAIDNFKNAVANGRKNLLMYAVMRFGKSFTALCCAREMNAGTVLVVSAKADVREEWKKTVQSADNFNQDYIFLSSEELNRDSDAIKNAVSAGKGVVIFLTLQDLQGDEIKEKHRELFENEIDLLIIDETHYGARAQSYGKVIRAVGYTRDIKLKLSADADGDDYIEADEAEEQLKSLSVNVKLHLSGTPYRILMGSEFAKEDIISFCQFSDIVHEQEKWYIDKEKGLSDDWEEWDNPYFGFPQMIRFAFTPSASALALLERLKSSGTTYALSELLRPVSISKQDDDSHKRFIHAREVLDLFEAIDGSKTDDSIFAFLDYDKIHEGKMCRHLVCVLPYCASCDALEALLTDNAHRFKNLGQYKIINISGVDGGKTYKTVQTVKKRIRDCEEANQKTITLTVNRMLTGSTVEQWDTMIFLKDTSSPQEYDQAIFRLQNQYIKSYEDADGRKIKYNMKPQTLLVDFDPHRMFIMQEQKSLIYNVNTDTSGNQHLKDRMEDELRISPIITVNKGKIEQVEAADILAIVSEYSISRGVKDEAQDIPVDASLFDIEAIRQEVERQAELGSKGGLKTDAYRGEGSDYDDPEAGDEDGEGNNGSSQTGSDGADGAPASDDAENMLQILQNKFKTYYSRVLFFAFLTEDRVASLLDILGCAAGADNVRIMYNLDLNVDILALMQKHMNPFILSSLDYKIQNINKLSHDENVPPIERAITAMGKFGKLSESEVTTPVNVAEDMVKLLPDECFQSLADPANRLLDIASKMGEFAIAVCKRCERLGIDIKDIAESVAAIPTSSVAYEFTRKVYKILDLNTESIAAGFTSYDFLKVKNDEDAIDYEKICHLLSQNRKFCSIELNDEIIESEDGDKMNFNAVVGNPPYQEDDGGAGASARPLYPYFVNIAKNLDPNYYSVIIPSKWFAGGKHLGEFRQAMLDDAGIREIHDCLHPEEIFPDTNNRGGICYLLWDKSYDNVANKLKVITHEGNGTESEAIRTFKTRDLDIFIRNSKAICILDKVIPEGAETDVMTNHISPRRPFAIDGSFIKSSDFHTTQEGLADAVKCYGKAKAVGFMERELVTTHTEWIDTWKVYMPYANNIGTELNDDNQNTFIGEPHSVCTETFLAVGMDLELDEASAKNLAGYLRTKFARFLLSLAKISQHGTSKTYRFVPVQDFNEEWTDEKLYAKYLLTPEEIECIEASIKPM